MPEQDKLYIALISVHGLIRGREPELGRDADTGGQVRYVLDLARALAAHPQVERVDLLTRQILGLNVAADYGEHREELADGAWIVRLPCGPLRYLRKESLWPHLSDFADHALHHFRDLGRVPDVLHGHYADAGAAGLKLARLLNIPLVFTGHSLGRVKRQRLAARGMDEVQMEKRYRIGRRIAAEERVIEAADLVVASTEQEVQEQYGLYSGTARRRMVVVPPGIHLDRFRPPRQTDPKPAIASEVERFLRHPKRPWILAIQRPDERKNLNGLIEAYAGDDWLRDNANLVLLIGTRDDIGTLPTGQRRVLDSMLRLVDRHDLYGRAAYPKRHSPDDIPAVYRWAARRRGVFVNPALTEPFGLTLIEAAASGLPVVATNDGGPNSIIFTCKNGILVDPQQPAEITAGLRRVLESRPAWRRMSRSGARAVSRHYSWPGHVDAYVKHLHRVFKARRHRRRNQHPHVRMVLGRRMLVCDIDNTLTGNDEDLATLVSTISAHREDMIFAVATGRTVTSAIEILEAHGVPRPDLLISAVGSEIHYGEGRILEDRAWRRHIDHRWQPNRLAELLDPLPGLTRQAATEQRDFKLSWSMDPQAPSPRELKELLKENSLHARVVFSHDSYLDLLPRRAGKGSAVRHIARRWGVPFHRILVAGDSGNDSEMLRLGTRAVVVSNHAPELAPLRGQPRIYFASAPHAAGVLEGLEHFHFFTTPGEES